MQNKQKEFKRDTAWIILFGFIGGLVGTTYQSYVYLNQFQQVGHFVANAATTFGISLVVASYIACCSARVKKLKYFSMPLRTIQLMLEIFILVGLSAIADRYYDGYLELKQVALVTSGFLAALIFMIFYLDRTANRFEERFGKHVPGFEEN